MAKYIVYCLNEAGKIRRSEWIDADSDEEALAGARAKDFPYGCEVWKGNTHVGDLGGAPDSGKPG